MLLYIQNGFTPNIRSRIVPPPIAVAIPTIQAPKTSKCFADAKRIPEIAKAKVPMNSMTTKDVGSLRVVPISCKISSIQSTLLYQF